MMQIPTLNGGLSVKDLEHIDGMVKRVAREPFAKFEVVPQVLEDCQQWLAEGRFEDSLPVLEDGKRQARAFLGGRSSVFGRKSWRLVLWRLERGETHGLHSHQNVSSFHLIGGGRLRSLRYDERMLIPPGLFELRLRSDEVNGRGEGYCTFDEQANCHWFEALEDETYLFIFSIRGFDPEYNGPGKRRKVRIIGNELGDPEILARYVA
jgi:hypothetical protein